VGRQDILTALQENAAKRRHTLLVGPLGIGKSHILRHFATALEQGGKGAREPGSTGDSSPSPQHPSSHAPQHIYLEHVSPIKPALLTLAQRLHADGNLAVEGIEANYMEWEDVRKKIAPLRVNQLADLVIKCMTDRNYVLLLDHLERVTPTMLPHLDALMDVAVVIAATDELKPSAQRLWWAFERVEVPPLPRDQARELLWQVADRDRVANSQLFETRVLQQAGGNPLAIITMAGKAAPRGTDRGDQTATLSAREIRGLRHGAGVRYVSLTPALMLIGALIVAARFVALGLNDRDLYVLAGLGYASFFFMRYFIYRID
jgi:energy-coupling factor transporter ATP-binding protein EcfA2